MSNFKRITLIARLQTQVVLSQGLPWHLEHVHREIGSNEISASEALAHFSSHKNSHGRTFASVFSRIYQRYEKEILSADNIWYAGIFFHREPTLAEATIYYLAYRGKFGLSTDKIPLIMANAH